MTLPWKYSSWKARALLQPIIDRGEAVCSKCGRGVAPGQLWDVDHLVAQDVSAELIHDPDNWAIAHRRCNRRAGARYGNAKRSASIPRPRASRPW